METPSHRFTSIGIRFTDHLVKQHLKFVIRFLSTQIGSSLVTNSTTPSEVIDSTFNVEQSLKAREAAMGSLINPSLLDL